MNVRYIRWMLAAGNAPAEISAERAATDGAVMGWFILFFSILLLSLSYLFVAAAGGACLTRNYVHLLRIRFGI